MTNIEEENAELDTGLNIKAELCEFVVQKELEGCFRYGVLYGMKKSRKFLMTDNENVSERLSELFGKDVSVVKRPRNDSDVYKIIFGDNIVINDEKLDRQIIGGDDSSIGAFLRGLFISCGTVSVQKKGGYHLELSLGSEEKCSYLYDLINEQGMAIKKSSRGGIPFLYSKDSENIADILTFIGAMQNAMKIMNIKIYKDFRSGINRVVNCEAANLEKTAIASAEQIAIIKLIDEKRGLESLSPELKEIAMVRLENPDISLSELGKLLTAPLTRSGVNHRLERLKKIAASLEKEA